MDNYALVLYLTAPLIGYTLGSVKSLRVVDNKKSLIIALTVSGLTLI